jgi:hypothetical protein
VPGGLTVTLRAQTESSERSFALEIILEGKWVCNAEGGFAGPMFKNVFHYFGVYNSPLRLCEVSKLYTVCILQQGTRQMNTAFPI